MTARVDIQPRKRYKRGEVAAILAALDSACETGMIQFDPKRGGRNVTHFYCGVEPGPISPKWNVQVFRNSSNPDYIAIVAADFDTLRTLVNEEDLSVLVPSDKPVVSIDDVGWGFPLCGVGVGVAVGDKVERDMVPVRYFRHDGPHAFATKAYLREYARLGFGLIRQMDLSPSTHRIEICTGYVNQPLREQLVDCGWEARVVEVKGALQDTLEDAFKDYVKRATGADLYYDPKEVGIEVVKRAYYAALQWGKQHCPQLIKTGWRSMKEYR